VDAEVFDKVKGPNERASRLPINDRGSGGLDLGDGRLADGHSNLLPLFLMRGGIVDFIRELYEHCT